MKESEVIVKEGGSEHGISEAIAFDYMQNIPYPHIPITEMFYARQLWLYNFGIHRFSDGESFMYPYTELVGKKGPNEVISFLHHFINNIDPNVRKLYIFTDACTAQNRNNTIVKYLSYLTDCGRFDYIRHVYPTKGHSYMACDRDFAQIELSKRKQDVVYTADDWIGIIQSSSKRNNVVDVEQTMIKDFKTVFSKVKEPLPIAKKQEKWKVTSYKIIEYRSNVVTASKSSSGLLTETFIMKGKAKFNETNLKRAYTNEIPLKTAKARDIAKYLSSVLPEKQPHFQRLLDQYGKEQVPNAEDSGSEVWDSD